MFKGNNASRAVRQAAKGKGLATVGWYEILDNETRVVTWHDPDINRIASTVVIRAYSPNRQKSVDITAGDLYTYEAEYQDAPMARIS